MTTLQERLAEGLVGRYEVLGQLGEGGMAIVYLARDLRHDRSVAVKALRPEIAAEIGEDRFLREIKLAAGLTHPHILPVHDSGNANGVLFYVMPNMEGAALRDRLEAERQRPLDEALRLTREVASALDYAHRHNVVHRDIKPENILVNRSGEIRLIDYALAKRIPKGLAKVFQMKPPREGTYSYIAPEVILRQPPSAQADIYSFGITCYELACGRQPFRANSPQELLQKHVSEKPIAPTMHNPNITKEYSDLVMSMLHKKPQDRIQDLREFSSRFSKIRIFKDDPDPMGDRLSM
ncbi:hypothetical protein BH23GEM2_BH23GEM2_06010 [soil metagenome]